MKHIAILFFVFLLPVLCLAEEKVYTNDDLIPGPSNYSKSNLSSNPQIKQQDYSNTGRRVISRGFFEQRDPSFQPKNEASSQGPLPHDDTSSRSQSNNTPATAINPPMPFQAPPQSAVDQMLANACASVSLLMLILVGIPFILWLVCLIDILRNDFTGNNKMIWFLAVLFLPVMEAILYFFIGMDQKIDSDDDDLLMT